MNALTSTLNYGALIALSCCNALLQIAATPACSESESDPANPGLRSQPVCGAFEVARGQLYLDEGQGWRNAVDGIEWGPH
jgi:hypothetical protein